MASGRRLELVAGLGTVIGGGGRRSGEGVGLQRQERAIDHPLGTHRQELGVDELHLIDRAGGEAVHQQLGDLLGVGVVRLLAEAVERGLDRVALELEGGLGLLAATAISM